MKCLQLKTPAGASRIYVNESMKNLPNYLPDRKTVAITDKNLREHYRHLFPVDEVIEIGQGEGAKTLQTVEEIYQRFLEFELDRSSFVLGIGGGLVCDITGFAASTYLRGLDFGFVPSTLVAQVDASIGGKNGINFKGYKNIVGIIRQPRFIFLDFAFLETLSERDYLCGVSEIIKSALIADHSLFEYLEAKADRLLAREREALETVVSAALAVKRVIVEKDVYEKGVRRLLNFGHTFGHAIESRAGLPHGEAVSIGMVLASDISVRRGWLAEGEARRIKALLQKVRLPIELPSGTGPLLDALNKDKKRRDEVIHFVLLSEIGRAQTAPISLKELMEYCHDLHLHR